MAKHLIAFISNFVHRTEMEKKKIQTKLTQHDRAIGIITKNKRICSKNSLCFHCRPFITFIWYTGLAVVAFVLFLRLLLGFRQWKIFCELNVVTGRSKISFRSILHWKSIKTFLIHFICLLLRTRSSFSTKHTHARTFRFVWMLIVRWFWPNFQWRHQLGRNRNGQKALYELDGWIELLISIFVFQLTIVESNWLVKMSRRSSELSNFNLPKIIRRRAC